MVAIRLLTSFIQVPIATYAAALGFSTSAKSLWPLLPAELATKISQVIHLLPYYPLVKGLAFNLLDPLLQAAPNWWAMAIGFPLILLGLTVILVNFFELYYALFSRLHNQARCPFCQHTLKIQRSRNYD